MDNILGVLLIIVLVVLGMYYVNNTQMSQHQEKQNCKVCKITTESTSVISPEPDISSVSSSGSQITRPGPYIESLPYMGVGPYSAPLPVVAPPPFATPLPIVGPSLPIDRIDREYDYRTLMDPLVPPRKRDDYNFPFFSSIATRGLPASYKKMGTLIDKTADNSDNYKFLFLMGRQKHRGSDWYQYYATEKGSSGYGALKFDLSHAKKELFTGDKIEIKELGREYEIVVDKNIEFDYNPYSF